jgi:hypothetical protein
MCMYSLGGKFTIIYPESEREHDIIRRKAAIVGKERGKHKRRRKFDT